MFVGSSRHEWNMHPVTNLEVYASEMVTSHMIIILKSKGNLCISQNFTQKRNMFNSIMNISIANLLSSNILPNKICVHQWVKHHLYISSFMLDEEKPSSAFTQNYNFCRQKGYNLR